MTKQLSRVIVYACAWFVTCWVALRGGYGKPTDHLLIACGFLLVHGAYAGLLGNLTGHARAALLAAYASASLLLLLVLLMYGAFIKEGGTVSADAMRAVAQTDILEAIEYLERLISPADLIAAVSIAMLLTATFPTSANAPPPRANAAFVLCMPIGLALAHLGSIPIISPIQAYTDEYRSEVAAFREVLDSRKSQPISGATSDYAGKAVVIIGESTSRQHMSRYGYFRETTPKLDARGDELLVFDDVISSHSHTVQALTAALTSAGASDQTHYFDDNSVDIVSLARSAGFSVSWLSNQNEFGVWDNPVTVIAKQAQHSRFFTSSVGKGFARSTYDAQMLPELRKELANSGAAGQLLFLHLFASHLPYCGNLPPRARHFNRQLAAKFFGSAPEGANVNCYDDAIRYIDSILDEAIRALEQSPEPAVLLYFSDHGEAPLLSTGHDSARHSSYHVEVPLLVWANTAYQRSRPGVLEAARANLDRPYSTGRLYHSIADLIGIKHASVDLRHSLFNAALVDVPRSAINGSIKYDEWSPTNDYRENASINARGLGKVRKSVWAHRINSLGALLEAKTVLKGVELDLVFVDAAQCFHVYHPPAPDISLSLAEMLAAAKDKSDLRLWFDWKNATPENMDAAIQCFDALDAQFGLRGRTLIETGSDAVFLGTRRLSAAGYTHGYYLPTETVLECLKSCDETQARELVRTITAAVDKGGYTAITFDWRLHDFVKQRLLGWTRSRKLALYSWDMSIDISQQDAATRIEERFSDLDLTTLLVTFRSQFRI
jgi:heptose-I-phosphate ethanolaminephosphotransferase